MLWGRSGNLCAFPDCKKELFIDENDTDDASLIGEECHIVAQKVSGPRGDSSLSPEQRDKYDNLILLCRNHHKQIDEQEDKYTIEKLKYFKQEHEKWVQKNLSLDLLKQKEDEIYSLYIDKFIELAEINNWKAWTSHIFFAGQPSILKTNLKKLRELNEYIISRVWFNRYPELVRTLKNFMYISNDFISVFGKYSEEQKSNEKLNKLELDGTIIWTEKFYKIDDWNPEKYQKLSKKYDYHCLLVEDLVLEMTRAANYIFDKVRMCLFSGFRLKEGVLLVEIGLFMDFSYSTIRTEYNKEDKQFLYQDLRNFMEERKNRSYSRGEGVCEDYFNNFITREYG